MIGLQTTRCAEPLPTPSVAAVTLGKIRRFPFQWTTPANTRVAIASSRETFDIGVW